MPGRNLSALVSRTIWAPLFLATASFQAIYGSLRLSHHTAPARIYLCGAAETSVLGESRARGPAQIHALAFCIAKLSVLSFAQRDLFIFFCPVSILALLLQSASLVRKGCLGSLADCLLPLGWPSSAGWAPAAASCGGQPWERAARATFTARSQMSMGAWPESCEACTRAEPVHPSLPPSIHLAADRQWQ